MITQGLTNNSRDKTNEINKIDEQIQRKNETE